MGRDHEVDETRGGVPWIVALIVVATIVVIVLAVLAVRIVSRSDAPPPTPSQPASTTGYSSVADMQSHDPFYVAHRGGSARWPEMSMLAYEKAVELGVGALEVSVARTKDGVYFGLHDKTLDRTSLVSGGIDPSTLTWAQLTSKYQNKLNATDPEGVPYARIDEIFAKFASNHVIFVDPKYIGDAGQRQDLIDQMLAAAPAEHWVLKGYYDNASLTTAARTAGIATWGYYYGRDLAAFDSTAQNWDMLGLDLAATAEQWAMVKAKGKPVIAFFISDTTTRNEATEKGANGMMVSDVPATFASPTPTSTRQQ